MRSDRLDEQAIARPAIGGADHPRAYLSGRFLALDHAGVIRAKPRHHVSHLRHLPKPASAKRRRIGHDALHRRDGGLRNSTLYWGQEMASNGDVRLLPPIYVNYS